MDFKTFFIFILGIGAILLGMYVLSHAKKGKSFNKLINGFYFAGIIIALILFIVGLFR